MCVGAAMWMVWREMENKFITVEREQLHNLGINFKITSSRTVEIIKHSK